MKSEMYVEALQLACLKGHLDIVDKLLSVGVDPAQVDRHGWTAIMCAIHSRKAEIRERLGLLTDDEKWQPPRNLEILEPSRLNESDKSPMLLLSDDGLCVTCTGMSTGPTPTLTPSLWQIVLTCLPMRKANADLPADTTGEGHDTTVRADHPIPLSSFPYYFEVTILDASPSL
jgi:hypothetical protein